MANLNLNLKRMLRHSERYFFALCAWCERSVGLPGQASACDCDPSEELLLQAAERLGVLGTEGDAPGRVRARGSLRGGRRPVVRLVPLS